jgi:hypothetical protein
LISAIFGGLINAVFKLWVPLSQEQRIALADAAEDLTIYIPHAATYEMQQDAITTVSELQAALKRGNEVKSVLVKVWNQRRADFGPEPIWTTANAGPDYARKLRRLRDATRDLAQTERSQSQGITVHDGDD